MSSIAALEQELAARQEDLSTCREMLALDPDSVDALETIPVLEADIVDIQAKIAAEKEKQRRQQQTTSQAPPPPPLSSDDTVPPPPPPPPKFDMSKHPKFRHQSPEPHASLANPSNAADETPSVFHVGNVVLAKYSADKQWYPATIISKTGSSADPVYSVSFKGYGNTETNKRKHEIRSVENPNAKKRKADGSMVPASTANHSQTQPPQQPPSSLELPPKSKPSTGNVISAAPSVDPDLVQRREPSKVSDGPTRLAPEPKKLKGSRTLEKSKSSWNEWRQSGPKKGPAVGAKKMGKDSQFRTADLPGAKVGFVGSGKPMQKDQARAKWNYGSGTLDE